MQYARTVLRLPQVREITGLSRSTIYAGIKAGLFPAPFRLGPRAVGFSSEAVEAWIDARMAGKAESEIRVLVTNLNSVAGGRDEHQPVR